MKLGAAEDSMIWKRSQELSMPFSNVLQTYVLESIIRQISRSSFQEVLWLSGSNLMEQMDKEGKPLRKSDGASGRLEFCYIESERKISAHQLIPGQKMSLRLLEVISREIFPENPKNKIFWEVGEMYCQNGCYVAEVCGSCQEMTVPVRLQIAPLASGTYVPQRMSFPFIMDEEKRISYLAYPAENILSKHLIEIMEKLELVADMESFAIVNRILQKQSISGRHILEEFMDYADTHPSFCKEKRLQQLQGYINYSYMKKRWDRYCKNHGISEERWEKVMELLLNFVGPIWTAFCANEIFLDDWMPELGRFLT